MSASITHIAKSVYKEYQERKFKKEKETYISHVIKTYPEEIPELTKAEEEEIVSFWKGKYGLSFPLLWHRFFYGTTGVKDPRYIPETVFRRKVRPFFNNTQEGAAWGDKAYLDRFLLGSRTVRCIIRNINGRFVNENFELIGPQTVSSIMNEYDELVIKPSIESGTGQGVCLLRKPYAFQEIMDHYKRDYVIQIPLVQHPDMAKLNASSVNTIRVNSVLFETEAHVMSAFVKVGQAGEFADNHGKDRFFIGIDKSGRFCDFAINHDLLPFKSIPSRYAFAGAPVPSFAKVCEAVEEAHKKMAHFGFIFWDVCVDINGDPVIVEANLRFPNTVVPQSCGIGPYLGDYTEEIMDRWKRGR